MARRINWDNQIGQRLKLRDLHVFFAVVQRGSMAKAGAHLGMSQPAVSEVIANLERTLEVRLFDRSPQGVKLTLYGSALLKRGLAAFDELRQGVRDMEFLSDPTCGELRFGCSVSVAATILPSIIQRFSRTYPRVILHMDEVPPPTQDLGSVRK